MRSLRGIHGVLGKYSYKFWAFSEAQQLDSPLSRFSRKDMSWWDQPLPLLVLTFGKWAAGTTPQVVKNWMVINCVCFGSRRQTFNKHDIAFLGWQHFVWHQRKSCRTSHGFQSTRTHLRRVTSITPHWSQLLNHTDSILE
jgi:hypothetical protein